MTILQHAQLQVTYLIGQESKKNREQGLCQWTVAAACARLVLSHSPSSLPEPQRRKTPLDEKARVTSWLVPPRAVSILL